MKRLRPPVGPDFLLFLVHLSSKLHLDEGDQSDLTTRVARQIGALEARFSHRRSIVLGDLNMNPFERGVVGSEGLHATMVREEAQKGGRVVHGDERSYFYNPMWRCLGRKRPDAPYGTYYYRSSSPMLFLWNVFDQVLVRPELVEAFDDESLEILTKAGDTDLLTKAGVPDQNVASDHLPIVFDLDFTRLEQSHG